MSNPTPPAAPKPAAKWASKMGAAVRRSPSLLSLGRSSEADDDMKSPRRSASRNLKAPPSMPTLTMEGGPGREEAVMNSNAVIPLPLAGTVTEPAVEISQPPTVVDPHVETNTPALPPPPGTHKPAAKWASKMGAAIRRSPSLLSLGRSSETDDDTKSLRRSASRNLKMSLTSPPPPVQSSPSMSTSTLEVHIREEFIINDDLLGSLPLARTSTESAVEIPQPHEVVDLCAEANSPVPLPPLGTPKPAAKWAAKMGAAMRRPSSLLSLRRPSAPSSEVDADAKSLRRSTSRSMKMPQTPPPPVESPPLMPASILESPTRDEVIMKDDIRVTLQPTPPSMPTSISETTAMEEAAMGADVVGSSPLARTDIETAVEAPQPTEVVDPYTDTNTPSSEADVDTKSLRRSTSCSLTMPQAPPPPSVELRPSMSPSISESPATEEAAMKADVVGFSPLARTITESAVEALRPTEVVEPYADTNTPEADADTESLPRNMSHSLKMPLTPTRPVQSSLTARNPPVAHGGIPLPTPPSMPTPPAMETSAREEFTTKADVVDPFPLARTVREPAVEAEAIKSVESTEPASAAEIRTAAPADETTSAVGLVPLPVIDAFIGNPGVFTDMSERLPRPTEVVGLYAETYTPAASPPAEEPAVSDAPEPMAVAHVEQHSRPTAEVAVRPATNHIDKPVPEPAVEPAVAAVPKSMVPVEKRSRSTAEVVAQPETAHVDKPIPKPAVALAKEPTVAAAPKPVVAPTEHRSRPRAVAEAASTKQFNSYLQVAIGVFTVVAFSASVLRWRR